MISPTIIPAGQETAQSVLALKRMLAAVFQAAYAQPRRMAGCDQARAGNNCYPSPPFGPGPRDRALLLPARQRGPMPIRKRTV